MQLLLQRKFNMYFIFWMCVCRLIYPACTAHVSYCHMWPIRRYKSFSHYLIKNTIFEKNYWTQTVCFDFLYNFYL